MTKIFNNIPSIVASLVAVLLSIGTTTAQERTTRLEYIAKWADVAIEHMEVYGIPASITMAQAVLESSNGNSTLARTANNHFGIKCGGSWDGEWVSHDDDAPDECFRKYDSAEESFEDHAEFLHTRSRYQFLFDYDTDDYTNWAHGLKKAGYATAPTYAEALIRIIEEERLYLLDQRGGRKLWDDYITERLGLNNKPEQAPKANTDTASTTPDQATAYADQGIDPNNFRVSINSHKGYNVYRTNGSFYIVARNDDTYATLAALFDLSEGQLRRFNDASEEDTLTKGDIVYIERKLARWHGNNLMHRATEAVSLKTLAQVYGIRLARLARLNHLKPSAELKKGDTIRLR